MSKKLKTRTNPGGINWPDEITLDCGSNMPMDVYGCNHLTDLGVLYIRHDVATKREQDSFNAAVNKCAEIASEQFKEP